MKFIVILTLLVFSSCALREKIEPIGNVFLEDVDVNKKLDNLPFDHSWVWAEVPKGSYNSILIPEISIERIPADYWINSTSPIVDSKEEFEKEAKLTAQYFREKLIEKFKNYSDAGYAVVDTAGEKTLLLEIALTEIEYSHPIANAATFASPIPGTSAAVSTVTSPHAAFALRISDSVSKKLLATAADRKYPPIRIVDLNKLTATSPVREVCANWAEEIVDSINQGSMAEVSNTGRFSLLPW